MAQFADTVRPVAFGDGKLHFVKAQIALRGKETMAKVNTFLADVAFQASRDDRRGGQGNPFYFSGLKRFAGTGILARTPEKFKVGRRPNMRFEL